jgi:hypothetical protein
MGVVGLIAMIIFFIIFDQVSKRKVAMIKTKEQLLLGGDPIASFPEKINLN